MASKKKPREVDILMLAALRELQIGEVFHELRVNESRRWKFDFAIPEMMLAVEIEGGISKFARFHPEWKTMRHQTGKGAADDCEKYATAVANGWTLFRFTTEMVRNGSAAQFLHKWNKNRLEHSWSVVEGE
ncbi:MAG TPA: hypothetical protein VND65_19265 [Candidatus Binatia bacterium]|nr:hypothetical protein [Candidatus Binatia bacterium]